MKTTKNLPPIAANLEWDYFNLLFEVWDEPIRVMFVRWHTSNTVEGLPFITDVQVFGLN